MRLSGATFVLIPKLRAANTGGEYTAVLADIITKYAAFSRNIVELSTDLSFDLGLAYNRTDVAAAYRKFLRANYIILKAKYSNDSGKLIQFNASGMKPCKKGNKTTWVTLMDFYAAAITSNAADFPAQFVTDANAFAVRYTKESDNQSKGQTKTGLKHSDRNTNRPLLEDALFTMLHLVIAYSHGNMARIKAIINLKSLEPHPRTTLMHIDNKTFAPNTTINLLHEKF
jgi:hypothetical protein